jgi:zinc transporter ZupT
MMVLPSLNTVVCFAMLTIPALASEPWEWKGAFEVNAGHYTWTASRAGGSYADASMKVLFKAWTGEHTIANPTLDALVEQAETSWENTATVWTDVTSGMSLVPGVHYRMVFDQHSWITKYEVDIAANGGFIAFCEHFPMEFEEGFHFFKGKDGSDIEPLGLWEAAAAVITAAPEKDKQWGKTILGSFITCLPTLLGVCFYACAVSPKFLHCMKKTKASTQSFASGVLFAASVFLLLPEGLHLAGAGEEEAVAASKWGTAILLGWLTCVAIHHACELIFRGREAKGDIEAEKNGALLGSNWMAIAGPIIFGDVFHNAADGFVIGAAFKNCDDGFAWKLVFVTVLHELPQEIVDFFILINDAGMRWQWATVANFLSSLSTVLCAIIACAADIGQNEEGYILSYGAGVFLFVAMTELGGSVVQLKDEADGDTSAPQLPSVFKRLLPFLFGCIILGLVLIGHEHCAVAVDGGAPAASSGHHH